MFEIFIEERVSKEIEKMSKKLKDNLIKKLKILEKGFSLELDIKKLKGFQNHYRMRIGNFRLLFYLNENNVIVYKIGKRENIYE